MIFKVIMDFHLEYQAIMANFIGFLHSSELLDQSRLKPTAFIRKRTLTFPVMLVAMLSGFKASVQTEPNAFFFASCQSS